MPAIAGSVWYKINSNWAIVKLGTPDEQIDLNRSLHLAFITPSQVRRLNAQHHDRLDQERAKVESLEQELAAEKEKNEETTKRLEELLRENEALKDQLAKRESVVEVLPSHIEDKGDSDMDVIDGGDAQTEHKGENVARGEEGLP